MKISADRCVEKRSKVRVCRFKTVNYTLRSNREPIKFVYIPLTIQWWRKRARNAGEWKSKHLPYSSDNFRTAHSFFKEWKPEHQKCSQNVIMFFSIVLFQSISVFFLCTIWFVLSLIIYNRVDLIYDIHVFIFIRNTLFGFSLGVS